MFIFATIHAIMGDYGLDLHCQMILDEYREYREGFEKMCEVIMTLIQKLLDENDIHVNSMQARVKSEESLVGKLELKGMKYRSLDDVTDICGARVITYSTAEVDKIAVLVETLFEIDWDNSVDKRKTHSLDSFGYNSLHYICRIPESVYKDENHPELNRFRFEIQMRTMLQHMWANMYHDIGYKSGVEVPSEYLRNLNRLAGMLELADDEFSRIRTAIIDYRRRVRQLMSSGQYEEVLLDGDTFRTYLDLRPFDNMNNNIAAINQAEIQEVSLMPYLPVLKSLGLKTLADIDRLIKDYKADAYKLACHQIGRTDLDIISSSVAIHNICTVCIVKNGGGIPGLVAMFDQLNGTSSYNEIRAKTVMQQVITLGIME